MNFIVSFKSKIFILLFVSLSVSTFAIDMEFQNQFTKAQTEFFMEAAEKAYKALFADDAFYRCLFREPRLESVDGDSVKSVYGDNWTRGELLLNQINVFRRLIRNSDPIPPIRFFYANKPDTFAWGWANFKKVTTNYDPETRKYGWEGRFELSLNVAHLEDESSSVNSWAGLMVHEMLHNLMHSHPNAEKVGFAAAYDRRLQVNAAQFCVGSNPSVQRCGGRF